MIRDDLLCLMYTITKDEIAETLYEDWSFLSIYYFVEAASEMDERVRSYETSKMI